MLLASRTEEIPVSFRGAASILVLALAMPLSAQAVPPSAGEIAVSEILFNPGPDACAVDTAAEWFEVTNVACKVLDLNGVSFEDRNPTTGLPSGVGFTVKASVSTLPPLFPGQAFVFARTAAAGLPLAAHYVYASAAPTPPPDGSQVGSDAMVFGNSGVDGLFVSVGGLASAGGTVIEAVTYNGSADPLAANIGVSAERVSLTAPWAVSGPTSTNHNVAQPPPGASFGSCLPAQRGSPFTLNGSDATLFPNYALYFDALVANTGLMLPKGCASITLGLAVSQLAGGAPGEIFALGFAPSPSDLPIALILGFGSGSFLVDLSSAEFLLMPNPFTAFGHGFLALPIPPVPSLAGATVYLQWFTLGGALQFRFSNGVAMTLCP